MLRRLVSGPLIFSDASGQIYIIHNNRKLLHVRVFTISTGRHDQSFTKKSRVSNF